MGAHRTIRLDMIDGFEFERVCADILSGAGWGRVERIGGVADGGRDLLVHGGDGSLTIVECKHQPNSSVGRPVVQKLHSAVMSEGASRGIIVTTGRFTDEAREHAAMLSRTTRIDLLDLGQLADLADRAGVRLVAGGRSMPPAQYLPDAGTDGARSLVMSRIAGLRSHPTPPAELARVSAHAVRLEPYYLARAEVEQDFSTSVGLIHSVRERDIPVLVDARSGSVCDPDATEFLADSPPGDGWDGADARVQVVREEFRCSGEVAMRAAAAHLARLYTQKVSYTGRNNVGYSKVCEVSPRSVHFADFRQVLLPVHNVAIEMLQNKYDCSVIRGGGDEARVSAPGLERCGVCEKGVSEDAGLCNACGSVHHPPRIFGCRGYRCKECRKTICRRCSFWTRRMLIFKRIICEACASGAESAQRMR